MSSFDVDSYLKRIHCQRERVPNLRFLKNLHRAHLLHIPFENLDIHLGNQILLDIDKMYKKIILGHRGGFCFELNGLFYQLLSKLGFTCHLISAQVYKDGAPGQPFEHAALLVYFEDQAYLVDVGFGDLFLHPKLLQPGQVQMDYNRFFKFDKTIDDEYILCMSENSIDYESKYIFKTQKRQLIEFIDMCDYHQTHKNSHFRKKKIITRATTTGRVTLTDYQLILTNSGKREEQNILNIDEFKVRLKEYFGL